MLTDRQMEVAALVARGMSASAIARRLDISPKTVDRHVQDAAARIELPGKPRHRITVWVLSFSERYGDFS
jgi:DNA-binding CsgD family transcriptional regulator